MLLAGGIGWAMTGGGADPDTEPVGLGQDSPAQESGDPAPGALDPQLDPEEGAVPLEEDTTSSEENANAVPPEEDTTLPDEQCTDEIRSNARWVCLTSATLAGGELTVEYDAAWAGDTPNVSGGYHIHLYGGDGTSPPEEIMGAHAANRGSWKIRDASPATLSAQDVADVIGDHPKVCARIADSSHWLVPDASGTYRTGNCVSINRG